MIIPHYNLGQLLGKCGVEEDPVFSGALKNMGSFARPMTDAERKIFQALVDDGFQRFKPIVQHGRSKFQQRPADLDRLATGQIYTAQQAKQNGLVDQIGFLEDAVDRAIKLANLDLSEVRVIKYEPEATLFGSLLGFEAKRGGVRLAGDGCGPDLAAGLLPVHAAAAVGLGGQARLKGSFRGPWFRSRSSAEKSGKSWTRLPTQPGTPSRLEPNV